MRGSGNGIHQTAPGDDGNLIAGDGCNDSCESETNTKAIVALVSIVGLAMLGALYFVGLPLLMKSHPTPPTAPRKRRVLKPPSSKAKWNLDWVPDYSKLVEEHSKRQ